MADMRSQDLIAEAQRSQARRAYREHRRAQRLPGALRIALVRMAARGLRVEREIDFSIAARIHCD
jgi:hypothetical protein